MAVTVKMLLCTNISYIQRLKSRLQVENFTVSTSVGSRPEKPESPNFQSKARWARARSLLNFASPIRPEPEPQARGYPKVISVDTDLLKNGDFS